MEPCPWEKLVQAEPAPVGVTLFGNRIVADVTKLWDSGAHHPGFQVDPKYGDCDLDVTRTGRDAQEQGHVRRDAEIRVLQPQARGRLGPREALSECPVAATGHWAGRCVCGFCGIRHTDLVPLERHLSPSRTGAKRQDSLAPCWKPAPAQLSCMDPGL